MNRTKGWLLGLGVITLLVLALVMLWTLPAGAIHTDPVEGTLAVSPSAVSPDNTIATADRRITITLTDPNLNRPLFVGAGPNNELPDIRTGDGERLVVGTGTVGPTGVISLKANLIDGFTPMADRNGDGTDGDIVVASIFNAARGQIVFNIFKAVAADTGFTVRYATPGRELSRAISPFTELIAAPNTGLVNGQAFDLTLNVDHLPLQDTNGTGTVTTADITIRIGTRTKTNLPVVTSIGTTNVLAGGDNGVAGGAAGRVISLVHSGDTVAADTNITVEYDGLADLVTVKGANDVEIPIRMRETGADTGVYKSTIIAIDGSAGEADIPNPTGAAFPNPPSNLDPTRSGDAADPRIAVIDGGAITVTYTDRNPMRTIIRLVQVEKQGPVFTNSTPANNARTNDLNTVLSTLSTDSIAGVNPKVISSVNVLIDGSAIAEASSGDIGVSETSPGSGVFLVEYNINNLQPIADAIANNTELVDFAFSWEITVKDKAGNQGSSGLRTLNIDTTQPHLLDAFTGDHYDPTKATGSRLRGARRPDTTGSATRNSVRVVFDSPMDGTTFQASDFLVSGDAPVSVAHYAVQADDPAGLNIDRSVFLTTAQDLAPDATPPIELVGEVRSAEGTLAVTGDVTARDGIAPTLTVTITPTYGTGDITVGIVADEKIRSTLPIREVDNARCVASTTVCTGDSRAAGPINQTVTIVTPQLEWIFKMTGFDVGRHSIIVRADDAKGNEGASGSTDSTAGGALVLEVDTALPPPAIEPADGATADFTEPFLIIIDWSSEGVEYTGDSLVQVALTKAALGIDVLGLATTPDGIHYTIPISNISLGAHTLVVSGRDEAGNTLENIVITFTVAGPSIVGTVILEGREDHSGTVVTATDGVSSYSSRTSADGSFGLSPPPGVYTINVERDGSLGAERDNVTVVEGIVLELPPLRLLGGDVNGDGVIDIRDISIPSKNLGKGESPWP